MNAKQTKLIEQAATVETDGEGWRKRMEDWLDEKHYARTKRPLDISMLNAVLGTSYA